MKLSRQPVTERDDDARHPGYRVAGHGSFDRMSIGDLALERGGVLLDAELGIVTLGELNAKADNAILLTTWYSGSHAAYVRHYVGPGRAIDPSHHFVIIANQLGNGFSTSSIDPGHDAATHGGGPPALSIADDVVAQERLVRESFGIERLALVAGCSMGAMQAYEWATRFPDRVERIAAVAGTAAPTENVQILITALLNALHGEENTTASLAPLRRHADLWALIGFSETFWNDGGWRALGFSSRVEFLEKNFDPLMLSRSIPVLEALANKWSRAGRYNDGSTIALETITAKTVVIPISHDWIYPPQDASLDAARIPGTTVETIESTDGHLSILGQSAHYQAQFDNIIGRLLRN